MNNSLTSYQDIVLSGRKESLHRMIMEAMNKLKEATFWDLSEYLKIDEKHIWKRLSELCKEGKIIKSADSKVSKISGKKCTVWKLV